MVIFHLQTSKETEFLYQTTCNTEVTEVIEEVVAIHNSILRIREMINLIRDLIKLGPMDNNNERHNPPENKEILERSISDAEISISKEQVTKKVFLTTEMISEELARLIGSITIVYPEGLLVTDPLRKLIEGEPLKYELNEKNAQFWCIKKSYQRGKYIYDYIGKNEKQTIVAKLTGPESGPPPRDMSVSKEEEIKLLSRLHKKAEELKRIEKDDDDSYLNSEWANPKGLKNSFQGLEDIDWKPH